MHILYSLIFISKSKNKNKNNTMMKRRKESLKKVSSIQLKKERETEREVNLKYLLRYNLIYKKYIFLYMIILMRLYLRQKKKAERKNINVRKIICNLHDCCRYQKNNNFTAFIVVSHRPVHPSSSKHNSTLKKKYCPQAKIMRARS